MYCLLANITELAREKAPINLQGHRQALFDINLQVLHDHFSPTLVNPYTTRSIYCSPKRESEDHETKPVYRGYANLPPPLMP
jgi:predicted  nucleic acid-binding Zn ribbon protein